MEKSKKPFTPRHYFTPEDDKQITAWLIEHRVELRNKKVTLEQIADRILKEVLFCNPQPGPEKLIKNHISPIIIKLKESEELKDQPWSISTIEQFPILPQALPAVLKQYKMHVEKGAEFTVRQAKWAAQLSEVENIDFTVIDLIAKTEQFCEILEQPIDLKIFDKLLSGMAPVGEPGKLPAAFWASMSAAGILENDPITEGKKSKSRKPGISKKKALFQCKTSEELVNYAIDHGYTMNTLKMALGIKEPSDIIDITAAKNTLFTKIQIKLEGDVESAIEEALKVKHAASYEEGGYFVANPKYVAHK